MGECMPSGVYTYEEKSGRSELTIETWDRDYPDEGDEPRGNFTAVDHERDYTATGGLEFEQVRAIHHVLGKWIDANREATGA
jgi:hypothetical protein